MASPKTQRAKCFTSHFKTDLSDHVITISPITARFPKVECSDGRHWQYKVFQPGQPLYGNLTFEGAEHKDSIGNIKSWVKDVYDGKEIRKDITIEVYDQAKDVTRTFNLIDTWPTALSIIDLGAAGQSGTVVKWTLEVRVNRIDMA
jgi:phage tail-like protein